MRTLLAAVAALTAQRLLGLPPLPAASAALLVPMVLVVAPAVRDRRARGPWSALLLGLGWDVVVSPVIGPGGIAWSVAALAVATAAGVVADRTAGAWFGFGALGAAVVVVAEWLALWPLGLAPAMGVGRLLTTALLTGTWCGAVGWIGSLDLPARWRRWRSRRLRT